MLRCTFLVLCLCAASHAILLGKLRRKEEPGSNVVPGSRVFYPVVDDEPPCKTDHGTLGRCVDIRMCYAARRAVSVGSHPVRCGWINYHIPKVCCHPDQVQHPKLVFGFNRPRRRNTRRRLQS